MWHTLAIFVGFVTLLRQILKHVLCAMTAHIGGDDGSVTRRSDLKPTTNFRNAYHVS